MTQLFGGGVLVDRVRGGGIRRMFGSSRGRKPIAFLLSCIAVLGLLAVAPVWGDEGDVVAVFKLKGPMSEAPEDMGLGPLLGEATPVSMFDVLGRLRQARSDANVRAVIFDIEEAQLGLAQIQELRDQFEALRAADKDVLVFGEVLSNTRLLLGSAASQFVLMPRGVVVFSGLYGEGVYFKNLLDNIHLEADIIHCGAYKAAGEPFCRTGPSPEAEEQMNWLFDSAFEQLVEGVAESRGLKAEKVRELIDRCMFGPKEALESKLVDKLQYREDFIQGVKKRYGKGTKVVTNYGKKKGPQINFENPFALFQVFTEMLKGEKKSDKQAIAVVFVEGMITQGESEPSIFGGSSNAGSATIRKAIAQAAEDEAVKALILRVDSPGGSAIASEVICEATKRFKKTGRPFIVSMGNVAGSGGYYVATMGDTIFAEPGTLTGSIGVLGGKIVTKGLWDWIGVTSHEYTRGKHGDLMNTNRRFTEEERQIIVDMMNRIYGEFKDRVQDGRGGRIKGDLEALAGGRVYTGKQALEIGLVDRLGGMADAIKHAAETAELGSDYELRIFPPPKSVFEMLAKAFGGQGEDEEFGESRIRGLGQTSGYAGLPEVRRAVDALRAVDPAKAAALRDFMTEVQLLGEENVLLIGPAFTMTSR